MTFTGHRWAPSPCALLVVQIVRTAFPTYSRTAQTRCVRGSRALHPCMAPLQPSRLVRLLGLRQRRGSLRGRGFLPGPLVCGQQSRLAGQEGRLPLLLLLLLCSLHKPWGILNVTGYITWVHVYPNSNDVWNVGEDYFVTGYIIRVHVSQTTATSRNTICYRVHYPSTRVPGRQRHLERRGTPSTLSGYTCTRTTATFRTFRTLGYNGYNSGVRVYPCSCRNWTYMCFLFAFRICFCFLLLFLIPFCLCACLGCSSVCRVPLKTHTNTIAQRNNQNNRQ